MSELAAMGASAWLPASVRRAQAFEEIAERKAGRDAEREREARREAAHDNALLAYRSAAEARGEVVSAMALAQGVGVGRSIGDVLADAAAAADMQDAREAGRLARERRGDVEHVFVGEPRITVASRSRDDGWPESGYAADRLVRMAGGLHRARVAYLARHRYPAAAEAARAKSAGSRDVSRSSELNVYQMPASGWEAVRADDARDGVIRRGTEGAIVGIR